VVSDRAWVSVVARPVVARLVDTSLVRVADIVRARVSIVAKKRSAGLAGTPCTQVADSTYVSVFARSLVVEMDAAGPLVAVVIGAFVAVVAVDGYAVQALPLATGFAHGAGIVVRAYLAVVVRSKRAFGRLRGAGGGQAGGPRPFGYRALDHGFRGYGTLLREPVQVAEQGPVAEVPVLERAAIFIALAVARNLETGTSSFITVVVHGARVLVVAFRLVEVEDAARLRVAGIVRAVIFIVAIHLSGLADALDAGPRLGAGIRIIAFDTGERFMCASRFSRAAIRGARVSVITETLPPVRRRIVHFSVTVVVKPVARLFCGLGSVAFAQASIYAEPGPGANAPLVLRGAVLILGAGRLDQSVTVSGCDQVRHPPVRIVNSRLLDGIDGIAAGD